MISTKFFPFTPSIPWKVKYGKYIVPKVNLNIWKELISKKDIVVVANGGLIESFVSLCYFEMMNITSASNKLFWIGDHRFDYLIKTNGLATISNVTISNEILSKYPTPIFLDNSNNLFFNCLNNYLIYRSWYNIKGIKNYRPILDQLFINSLTNWNCDYLPNMRRMIFPSKELLSWCKVAGINLNNPYICIFPDKTNLSIHKESCLQWDNIQIKALAACLKQKGISTIVITNDSTKYYNSNVYTIPIKLELPATLKFTSKPPKDAAVTDCTKSAPATGLPLR